MLQRAVCGDDYCKTLEKYEKTRGVTLNGITLHEDLWMTFYKESDLVFFERLSNYKDPYLDGIDAQLRKYMPNNALMKTMASLDQSRWPGDVLEVLADVARMEEIKKWPALFNMEGYSEENFKQDFSRLIHWLNNNKEWWCDRRDSSPQNFWSTLLSSPARLYMSDSMIFLIKSTLCSPYGSADSERCFSKYVNCCFFCNIVLTLTFFSNYHFRMNIIKVQARTLLSTKSLNALMWISMSNKDLLLFDFVRAANRYLRNHRRCDDERGTSQKPTLQEILSLEGQKQHLMHQIQQHRDNIRALEADLEAVKADLQRDSDRLETITNNN